MTANEPAEVDYSEREYFSVINSMPVRCEANHSVSENEN